MYNNKKSFGEVIFSRKPGEIIKIVALVEFVIMALGALGTAFVFLMMALRWMDFFELFIAVLIAIAGVLSAYIVSLFTYGLGQLITSNQENKELLKEISSKMGSDVSNNSKSKETIEQENIAQALKF